LEEGLENMLRKGKSNMRIALIDSLPIQAQKGLTAYKIAYRLQLLLHQPMSTKAVF